MEEVLIGLKNKDNYKFCVLPSKQKDLVALGRTVLAGNKNSIEKHVINALDTGVLRGEILKVVEYIVGDKQLLRSLIDLLRVLSYGESRKAEYISVFDDVRGE